VTRHRCTCGDEFGSKHAYIDHVADEHDALTIAAETLREEPADPTETTR